MKVRDRRNLPIAVEALFKKLRSGKPKPAQLGVLIGELRTACIARGLTLVTLPCPAIAPCLIWIFKGDVPRRLRRVVRRSAPCRTYRFTSCKSDEDIECEGDNEYEVARRLDLDAAVEFFFEQTPVALFLFEGTIHLHTPDFVVEWRVGGLTVIDVLAREVDGLRRYRTSRIRRRRFGKMSRRRPVDHSAKGLRERQLLEAAATVYRQFGLKHITVRAEELDDPRRRENVNTIFPHRFASVPLSTRLFTRRWLRQHDRSTLGELLNHVRLSEAELWALVATDEIRLDLNLPLDDSAIVTLGGAA
jgi:hypothetical protein